MNRRTFIAAAGAMLATPALAADYTPGLIEKALRQGKTVFVDYTTDWCSTCARQKRVMAKLRAENPAYDAHMLFVTVDYDAYGTHPVTTSRNIPRRSTLLVLRGDQELGRIVAGTSEADIKALMDAGLAAAS